MAVDKIGGLVSMGRDREEERRAAGILTTLESGEWRLETESITRVYEVLGFDEDSQSTRLRVLAEERS